MNGKATTDWSASVRQLRIRMLQRELDTAALARLIRFDYRHVVNVLAGNTRSWPVMRAINCALREKIFRRPRRVRLPKSVQRQQFRQTSIKL